jgi:hypothetical protein
MGSLDIDLPFWLYSVQLIIEYNLCYTHFYSTVSITEVF